MPVRCSMCLGFVAGSLRLLLNHMRRSHANDPSFHVLCGIDGCSRTYKRFISFRNHLIRKHNFKLTEEDTRIQIMQPQLADDIQGCEDALGTEQPEAYQHEDCTRPEKMKENNARCLLGFKDKGRVPQTVVNLFVQSSTQLVRNSLQHAGREVEERLRAVGTNIMAVQGLKEIFEEDSLPMNPFSGLENEQQQSKFYKDNFKLVVSTSQSIGNIPPPPSLP